MSEDVDFNAIARAAAGASGAELANMINEAALRAVRCGRTVVTQADLEESVEVVIAGYQKKNKVLSDKEKLIVAYHESRPCPGGSPADPFCPGTQRSPSFPVPLALWAIPCRWMKKSEIL